MNKVQTFNFLDHKGEAKLLSSMMHYQIGLMSYAAHPGDNYEV